MFVFFMWEGEIITSYHIKSFSPFCVSVPNSAVAQNGAVRKRLPLFSFLFFRTSMNRAAFLPHCSHSRVKQVAGRETEEKNSSKDEPCSPSRPLKEGHYT